MKKRGLLLILLLAAAVTGLVIWLGMADRQDRPQEGIRLYFVVREMTGHGSALGWEQYKGSGAEEDGMPTPRALVSALLAGPAQEELVTPFPKGVGLESCRWDPEREGNLQLRLSEQYSGLTDISLTLADYCIVLTLCQLPEVQTVEITSGGYAADYRSHEILKKEEAILLDPVAAAGTLS